MRILRDFQTVAGTGAHLAHRRGHAQSDEFASTLTVTTKLW